MYEDEHLESDYEDRTHIADDLEYYDPRLERDDIEVDENYLKEEEEAYAWIAQQATEWEARWPNHCRNCRGWGGFVTPGKYSGPPEYCYPEDFDLCEALPDDQCHRCGAHALYSPDPLSINSPICRACGWSYDDGAPG